jgi:type I restriction enzyme S subunit
VKNVEDGRLSYDTDKFISQTTYEELTRRCPIEVGDVLYVTVGATYGDAVVIESDTAFCFQRHLAHLKPNPKAARPAFLHNLLRSTFIKRQADRRVRGAAQPTLNLGELRDFEVFLPPISEQLKFENVAVTVRRMRTAGIHAYEATRTLFDGLVREAYSEHTSLRNA